MFRTVSFIAVALVGTAANAAPTIYNINQNIGLGSVIGTIKTNGTVGSLTQSDVLGFDLTVNGLGASVNLTQENSILINQGSNFSATTDNLLFDYSGPSGFLLFQQEKFGTGMKYYCNSSVADTCFQGASAIPEAFNDPSAQVEARVGQQIIGSVAGAVPEPATWALMILGFGAVGCAMRRRTEPAASVSYA